jgi:hypothetical protein
MVVKSPRNAAANFGSIQDAPSVQSDMVFFCRIGVLCVVGGSAPKGAAPASSRFVRGQRRKPKLIHL